MKNNKRQAELAITTLKEIFIESLIPKNQKLRSFMQCIQAAQPDKKNSSETLIAAYVEHNLKRYYRQYIEVLCITN